MAGNGKAPETRDDGSAPAKRRTQKGHLSDRVAPPAVIEEARAIVAEIVSDEIEAEDGMAQLEALAEGIAAATPVIEAVRKVRQGRVFDVMRLGVEAETIELLLQGLSFTTVAERLKATSGQSITPVAVASYFREVVEPVIQDASLRKRVADLGGRIDIVEEYARTVLMSKERIEEMRVFEKAALPTEVGNRVIEMHLKALKQLDEAQQRALGLAPTDLMGLLTGSTEAGGEAMLEEVDVRVRRMSGETLQRFIRAARVEISPGGGSGLDSEAEGSEG